MTNPTVKRLGPENYRLAGGDLANGWKPRVGEAAWCEITVNVKDGVIRSYGGEVWPSAWPHLFSFSAPSTHGQTCTLTPEGKSLLLTV